MNCQECHDYIDAYHDSELDVSTTILVKQHLRNCLSCQRLLETRQEIGNLLSNLEVRFSAPDSLLDKIQAGLPVSVPEIKHRSRPWFNIPWFSTPLALAATIAVVLGLFFLYQRGRFDRWPGKTVAQEVISSHVRSLLATHLLDVPSTDQHTVKPWFNGKLKFSPPVHDFADHGFRLVGGRLDYFDGHEVAAIVYQRNQHVINLFTWPSESGRDTAVESFSQDGYNVSHWENDGFEFWAVSDVNAVDLSLFARLERPRA